MMRHAVLTKARIVERRDATRELWLIKLEPEAPYTFKPGQYCTIGVEGIERAYSIVSSPEEPLIELIIGLVSHGELTPRLYKLGAGAEVSLRPKAKGLFTLEEKYVNHLMVATTTGIAPFMSILRYYLRRGGAGKRFYLLMGVSHQDELPYKEELERMAREHPCLRVLLTVSRPQAERNRGWTGRTGRINVLVEEYIKEEGLAPEDTVVYACGHPGMIQDIKERLTPRGFRVKEERYWKEE
ncbi:MAG: ferredoxin--NADP reductase [Chloroflexi bacterium]|nr:ferredoxin--NADP reductase [Chloroflexota bacterium]